MATKYYLGGKFQKERSPDSLAGPHRACCGHGFIPRQWTGAGVTWWLLVESRSWAPAEDGPWRPSWRSGQIQDELGQGQDEHSAGRTLRGQCRALCMEVGRSPAWVQRPWDAAGRAPSPGRGVRLEAGLVCACWTAPTPTPGARPKRNGDISDLCDSHKDSQAAGVW